MSRFATASLRLHLLSYSPRFQKNNISSSNFLYKFLQALFRKTCREVEETQFSIISSPPYRRKLECTRPRALRPRGFMLLFNEPRVLVEGGVDGGRVTGLFINQSRFNRCHILRVSEGSSGYCGKQWQI